MARRLLPDRGMRRLVTVLVLLTGCNLYWTGDGDDVVCALDIAPSQELRNPVTGDCEYFNGPGYPCDDFCGPCPESAGQPTPDWGACYSQCNGLEEASCLTASGCLAAYYEDPRADSIGRTFRGCFVTAPSGPVSTGACTNLDAQQCSRHDNCAMVYDGNLDGTNEGNFAYCAPEPTAMGCATVDCGPGHHCEEQCRDCGPTEDCSGPQVCSSTCVPDGNTCATTTCQTGYECVEVCSGGGTATGGTTPGVGTCTASCVPVTACAALPTEAACTARPDCTSVYIGTDCTCYPNQGCTCEVLTYDHCEAH